MRQNRTIVLVNRVLVWSLFLAVGISTGLAVEKIVDGVLLEHDESPGGVYRWSEGTILNLGKQNLMLLVSAFGHGGHDGSSAHILEFHSHDGGRTWTPLAEARVFQQNIGKRNVMAPSLLQLKNGDILCFFNVMNSEDDHGPWVRRSADIGKSWSEPLRLPYTGYGGVPNDGVVQLSTGRIVVPAWQSTDRLASDYAYCFYSDDQGETWNKTELIATPKGSTGRPTDPAAEEPAVTELKDGRLLMLIRTYLKSIYRSYSEDGGSTWSDPESSGIPAPGAQPKIYRLPTGDILLIYNSADPEAIDGAFPRNVITAAISKDEGQSFSFIRHLDGGPGFAGKITMPIVEFVDDNAVVMYSKSESKKNTYDWRLQVLPIDWFYEGDQQQVFGQAADAKETVDRSSPD